MTKIRGWYKGDDGQMHEMEGTCDARGVVTFPHVPSGGVLIEGVDMSGISPVYMTPENPAREEIPAQAEIVDFDIAAFDKLLDTYTRVVYSGGASGHVMEKFALIKYIDDLLAAKDAEIARLQANQITPEMIALWHEYQAMGADEYLYHAERFKGRLWQMFAAKMGGGE